MENRTHSQRIAEGIQAEITSGHRVPGSHLNEQEIADHYRVSRTPVREAVRQLASAGLVEVLPRRGAFVTQLPAERLVEMFEAMSVMEGACARLAATRMTEAEKQELVRVHEAYAAFTKQDEWAAYYDASLEFHRLLIRGARNSVLEETAARMFAQLTPYRRSQVNSAHRAKKSFQEHQAVLEAILEGDGDLAESRMREHTGVVGDNAVDLLRVLRNTAS